MPIYSFLKSFPQSSHSTNATTINANILAFVHFKGNTKKRKKYQEKEKEKESEMGQKKPLQINANGITEKRYTSEESGTDTSRKLYLHHLHIKLVCTTATAAGHMDNMDKCCMQHQQLETQPHKAHPHPQPHPHLHPHPRVACHVDLYKYIKSQITIFRRLK